jgi:1-aminocyclopropane-1-carboxylate deaminase/D-cysteine desulfhydrase-like pyridoxal-dependent ACC family enzyme
MHEGLQIPSPLHRISYPAFERAGIEFWLKRDDQIHHAISGNKWRKLVHNFREAQTNNATGIVTFGGAFSNHLAATAFAAARDKLPLVAFVRGLDGETTNPTLNFLKACGATVIPLSRADYAQKNEPDFLAEVQTKFPGHAIIPEGGANLQGVRGCMEILDEVQAPFNVVATPVGTTTTLSGLLLSGFNATFIGFTAVKGGAYLTADVNNFIHRAKQAHVVPPTFPHPEWQLQTEYHFGGFGKVTPELIAFMNAFYQETGVPLDPIYTGKMVFGLAEMASQGQFKRGTRILALHTGGLQGIFGMNERLRKKHLRITYEEAVDYPFPPPPF